jgi:methyltransferase-like protein/2-polyprenyl-3-methyl-5-hydroxy-6-metoxy-1,4-benzoquinol methylase
MNEKTDSPYDDIPYPSVTHRNTRPEQLAAVARIFGMEPVDFSNARVLELGCAGGGNLISMAAAYPDSRFVGIDLSQRQIDVAGKAIDDLGLTNIELKRFSVTDVDRSFGIFDYIIAHGIYSWVSDDVRDAIITVCKENLSQSGIAYVSYNTLPGWDVIKTIRDMMVYHSQNFADAETRIREARQMLNFVIENSGDGDTPYKQMLQAEATRVSRIADGYLYHDHLEHHNDPCYFHEFMSKAADRGLQYLGDHDFSAMNLSGYTEPARGILAQIDDIVRQEQYIDFLTNRRFRQTMLCHADVALSRNVTSDRLSGLFYRTSLVPEGGLDSVDLSLDKPTVFINPANSTTLTANNRAVTGLMVVLAENNSHPVSVGDLVVEVHKRLETVPEDVIRRTFLDNAKTMIFSGGLSVSTDAGFQRKTASERPKAWFCSRYIAQSQDLVPTVLHDTEKLGSDLLIMIQYVDGTRTHDEIAAAMMKHVLSGELICQKKDVPVTDEAELRPLLKEIVKSGLRILADKAYLVA